jgi:hypothetical protein
MDERCNLPSASSLERLMLCPGSHNMSLGLQPLQTPEQSEWAESGERIHLWLEDPSFVELQGEELETAEACAQQREQLLRQAFPDLDSLYRSVIIEKRLWLVNSKGEKIFSGKGDYAEVVGDNPNTPSAALVIDYKTNRGDVTESVKNPQTRALAVLLDFELAFTKGIKIPKIYTGIIQPHVSRHPELCCYERPHLDAARKQVLRILEDASKPDAPLNPGEKQCKWCPAKLKCKAARSIVADIVKIKLEDLIGIKGADLSKLLDQSKVAQQVIDAADAQARAFLAKDPACIPNWCLEPNSPIRVVTKPLSVFQALHAAGKIDQDHFMGAVKIGIGELEKAIGKFNSLDRKPKLREEIITEHVQPFITLKPKNPSLKRK